ncbi:MAG: DNA polymerase III subunit beta [Deltaproteobacteria bacterium]|nr:DNA polymerase III subunit beta [Deltaproteobacteria bacterium]
MKIKIKKTILLNALSRIQGIVEKNSIKPITSNALFKASNKKITLSATNLQIAIKTNLSDVKIEKEGQISLNAKKIFEIVKNIAEEFLIIEEKDNFHVSISAGKTFIEMLGLPPEDFPDFEEEKNDFKEWNKNIFLEMINLTSFSISRDESKPNICGSFIEYIEDGIIRMVTTDGYRLSIVEEKSKKIFDLNEGITIPVKGINEIYKILLEKKDEEKIYVSVKKNIFILKINDVELYIRLLEKKYPNYKVIIPGEGYNKKIIKLDKNKLREALKIMCVIANENNRPVYFRFLDNNLSLHTEDSDFGSAREDIILKDKAEKEINFCINGSYLIDIINVLEEDFIIEYFEEENKPIVVKKEKKDNVKYIIMPMRMD